MSVEKKKVIALFDVDGTLSASRCVAPPEIKDLLKRLQERVDVGIVGGSDLVKQEEQLGKNITKEVKYVFSQNGLVAYRDGEKFSQTLLTDVYSNEQLNKFINFCLRYIADLDIPVKRGTFVEFRSGMINVCPVGRNCSQEERNAFGEYDKEHHIRENMVEVLKKEFPDMNFVYLIGGQISFDVVPKGWDKTYCLQFLKDYDAIHFFGDKTMPGGNDYEIFSDARTIGHTVTGPFDTIKQCEEIFFSIPFLSSMSAIDGWVEDVEDALSKAESSYRQITEDTDAGEKRMLLTESKNLMNEAKDNLDALSVQIKKLPRDSQFNYLNTQGKTIDAAKNTLQLLQETKQVALATTETLSHQTDQISGMKGDVEGIDNQLKRSEQLIRTYLVRMMTDKIIMGLIFFLVVLIVVAVVLYAIFGKKNNPTEAPTTPPFSDMAVRGLEKMVSVYLRK
ncbi:hypothetical protein BLSTO_03772 [Blastocystis sp. subtype 1]